MKQEQHAAAPSSSNGSVEQPQVERARQRHRTAAVMVVGVALAVTPLLAVLGRARLAVVWLAAILAVSTLVRLQRPDGSWIAARSRLFDAVFGTALVLVLLALASYAALRRI
ncbi:DUF3017 domain-containing protein [Actinomyces trachealis]|uniref:DUF3017 domain-containing protein n=1 Tax=Actinomyces trachealis TaxID=2763540 RepID=UPI001892B695|nr:DUF3017 domain-containing protein [Actinomyces trachealis]